MGQELDLLKALPKSRRNVSARAHAKTEHHIEVSRQYGEAYFDGPREYGYGGYRYDGRWVPVARDIVAHYGLRPGNRVLDVGCAKGFLVKDLLAACPGLEVFGLDISYYGLTHSEPEARGRLVRGSADRLPFADGSFDFVISLDTIHNLQRDRARAALSEIQRLSNGRAFVRVDSYRTEEQRDIFENWVLTANFHDYPDGWLKLFREAGYTGDYNWTIIAN